MNATQSQSPGDASESGRNPGEELSVRLSSRELLPPFGILAVRKPDELEAILREATRLCAEGLQAAFCKVLEWVAIADLAESERKFRATFEQAAVGIAHVALDGTWVRVNRRLCEITGYDHDEMQNLRFQDITHPDDLQADLAQMRALLAQEIATYSLEKRYCCKGGREVWVNVTVSLVHEADGTPAYCISVVEDISHRKRVEAELRELTASLEQRVAAEVAHREQAEADLRYAEKMKAIDELTGGIAHRLNNVLMVISGHVELAADAETGATHRHLSAAMNGVGQGAKLADDMLAFARRTPLRPEPLDLIARVQAMRDMLDRTLGEEIRLEADFGPTLWTVYADADQLDLAILSAAVNARDAMPHGGTCRIVARNVVDGMDSERGWVELAISDTGPGMSKEIAAQASEPFFTGTERGGGTGIGLSQVHTFAAQSGGTARIESKSGQGTTVRLRLPAQVA